MTMSSSAKKYNKTTNELGWKQKFKKTFELASHPFTYTLLTLTVEWQGTARSDTLNRKTVPENRSQLYKLSIDYESKVVTPAIYLWEKDNEI